MTTVSDHRERFPVLNGAPSGLVQGSWLAAAGLVASLLLSPAAEAPAQIISAQVYESVTAGVTASDNPGGSAEGNCPENTFFVPAMTTPIGVPGNNDQPFNCQVTQGNATALVSGDVRYNVLASEITASGTFHQTITAGPSPALARSNIAHADLGITFSVAQPTMATITGFIALNPLKKGNQSDMLDCALGGDELVGGSLANANLSPVPFDVSEEVDPGNPETITCYLTRDTAAGDGFPNDDTELSYSFAVMLGATATTTVPSTTSTTVPRKACRHACRRSLSACRHACGGKGKASHVCRRTCQRAEMRCGEATGCQLPLR